jgi:hypothetical protein
MTRQRQMAHVGSRTAFSVAVILKPFRLRPGVTLAVADLPSPVKVFGSAI